MNSHSGNTDSQCSRQSSLRYLDSELTTRRPLVVSFRRPQRNDCITKINRPTKHYRCSNDCGTSFLSLQTEHNLDKLSSFEDIFRQKEHDVPIFANGDLLEPKIFSCPKKTVQEDLFNIRIQQKSDFFQPVEPIQHHEGCSENQNDLKDRNPDCDFHLFSLESSDFTTLEIQNLLPAHVCPLTFKNSQCPQYRFPKKKRKRLNKNQAHISFPKSHTTSNINNEQNTITNDNSSQSLETTKRTERSSSFCGQLIFLK